MKLKRSFMRRGALFFFILAMVAAPADVWNYICNCILMTTGRVEAFFDSQPKIQQNKTLAQSLIAASRPSAPLYPSHLSISSISVIRSTVSNLQSSIAQCLR
jgi:hypothetical protein